MAYIKRIYQMITTCHPAIPTGVVGLVLVIAVAIQWQGPQTIATNDSVHYIVSGVNLVRTGSYTNPAGTPEIWYPPLYPLLVGIFSIAGRLDPLPVARLISVICAVLLVVLVFWTCRRQQMLSPLTGLFVAVALVCNAQWQMRCNGPMTESLAGLLSFSAFSVWLCLSDSLTARAKLGRYGLLGLLFGLAYLTRCETIILLPILAAIDLYHTRSLRVVSRYWVVLFVFVLIISPHLVFLYKHTGKLTMSTKSEIVLAIGRAGYYKENAYYGQSSIDPETLEITYYKPDVTIDSEARRYVKNLWGVVRSYGVIYHGFLGGGLVLAALFGLLRLTGRDCRRLRLGLLAQFACLPVLAFYIIGPRYLHSTLPALSVFVGIGLAWLIEAFVSRPSKWPMKAVVVVLVLWAGMGLAEGCSRYPRWFLQGWELERPFLRDVGLKFESLGLPKGLMLSRSNTIAYYAKQNSELLGLDELSTIIRYVDRTKKSPVYLAVSSSGPLHRSVQELLLSDSPPVEQVLKFEDDRGQVRIYRIK